MTVDVRLAIEIVGAIVLLLGAIQAYRAGLVKNKSVQMEAAETLHSMLESDSERYYKRLKECEGQSEIYRTNVRKWRTAFSGLTSEARNAGFRSEQITMAKIETMSLPEVEDLRNGISNAR